jgi:hypothetical protein
LTKPRIYNSGTNYCKDPAVYKLLGIDGSILTITDPDEHKQYRSIVSSLFSQKTTDDLAPMMATLLNKSAESMARQGSHGNPSVIQRVYRSVAVRHHIPGWTKTPLTHWILTGRYGVVSAVQSAAGFDRLSPGCGLLPLLHVEH